MGKFPGQQVIVVFMDVTIALISKKYNACSLIYKSFDEIMRYTILGKILEQEKLVNLANLQ